MFPSSRNEWIKKLLSFDTTSRNSNLQIIDFLKSYLDSLNIKTTLSYSEDKTKANLFATICKNEATKGGVILSGHLDTVPVDGQKWDTDPFQATEKDGKIYGRGSCDMKGFVAVCMHLVPTLKKIAKRKPVYLAWTFDEEVGCLGGRVLTNYIRSSGIVADGCIIGEPTSNQIVVAHKGIHVWRVTVKGKSCHSSMALTPKGCNAIDYSARLIVRIREIAESLMVGQQDTLFDIPFTTMSTNIINGGTALNIVPAECKFTYEFRNLPTEAKDSIQEKVRVYVDDVLLPLMRKECPEADILIESTASVPGMLEAKDDDPFQVMLRKLVGPYPKRKIGFTTEGGQYTEIGISTVVCGPGDIAVAHMPNEFVPCKDLDDCEAFILKVIERNQGTVANI
uniref:Acetylornithine deacetylase n=1 Tax=Angomonas desouzai TaxID=59800 RepID=U5KMI9_9TRYP|nr:acetylornithine deacetylase [Angomonas desouzai]